MEELVKGIRDFHPGIAIKSVSCRTNQNILHIQIEDSKQSLSGAGSAENATLALKKAYSEFIERASMRSVFSDNPHVRTSSGFARHTKSEYAAVNSVAEIIERDALLCTWLVHVPPYWLNAEEFGSLQLPAWYAQSEKFLLSRGIAVKVGIVAVTGSHYTVVAALHPVNNMTTFGCLVETSCNRDLSSAVGSALLGAMRMATCLLNRMDKGKVYRILDKFEIRTVIDHMDFYLNPGNFPNWFFESNSHITALVSPPIEIEEIQPIPNPFDLKVTRASSEKIQDFFVGSERRHNNFQRIEENFTGCCFANLNTMPHPIV